MANLHEMLGMNGGSFQKAEQMALDFISKGHNQIWLDLALLFCAQGNYEASKQAQNEYAKYFPDCPRLKFGRTWHLLHDGNLQDGLEHIEAGRVCGTLGEPDFSKLKGPKWNGKNSIDGKTILLYGEGGQGDQIMGLRSCKKLSEMGAKVTIACSKSLLNLFGKAKYVNSVVSHDECHGVRYDYWIPMMSSFKLCQLTEQTLWEGNFITPPDNDALWKRIIPREDGKLNVGLRWRGNPEFEHEQLRWFPVEYLFHATDCKDVNLYSLQKDDTQILLPKNVTDLAPLLGDWEQTAMAMNQLDLIITSCTSVAHLSAAMGKPTWVIVPAMPYYPWAKPGNKSYWYPTVTLFRQKCYGNWIDAFSELKESFERKVTKSKFIELSVNGFYNENNVKKIDEESMYINIDELSVISALINKHEVKSVLEIGINSGESAKIILNNCKSIEKYTGIEITKEASVSMMDRQSGERTRLGDDVGKFVKDDPRVNIFISENGSKDFVHDGEYDLVFIDGNHSEKWARFDTELAMKLKAKIIIWHDYSTEDGVTKVVDEIDESVVRILRTRLAYLIVNNGNINFK